MDVFRSLASRKKPARPLASDEMGMVLLVEALESWVMRWMMIGAKGLLLASEDAGGAAGKRTSPVCQSQTGSPGCKGCQATPDVQFKLLVQLDVHMQLLLDSNRSSLVHT